MGKLISEKIQEQESTSKLVEIKHTRSAKDATGKDVEILDYIETKPVEDAISQAESKKADLESKLSECEAELADYIAIRDAE